MKQGMTVFVINLLLFIISIFGFTPYAKEHNLEIGDISHITPFIAFASYMYIKFRKRETPLKKQIQIANIIFLIAPIVIWVYIFICFFFDLEIKFLWGL